MPIIIIIGNYILSPAPPKSSQCPAGRQLVEFDFKRNPALKNFSG